jgi:hypothetical protein
MKLVQITDSFNIRFLSSIVAKKNEALYVINQYSTCSGLRANLEKKKHMQYGLVQKRAVEWSFVYTLILYGTTPVQVVRYSVLFVKRR